ncbi:antitoxin Xre/MbcA/ParS toxin-binding domain-containing protein [Paraburkholderia sp. MM6662-R1]|uniref:antitoxin Xre/MbcA/ParS toxin-binding domain-containing protein n=1 Tax=Paraburkholderia sp. MM6662-R1 TaxID=2991066 RepID=UPI003D1EE8AE
MGTDGWSQGDSVELLRLARICARAAEVFNDLSLTIAWLKTPIAGLGGVTPLSLVNTKVGTEKVMDTLGRIEHGVFG